MDVCCVCVCASVVDNVHSSTKNAEMWKIIQRLLHQTQRLPRQHVLTSPFSLMPESMTMTEQSRS